MKKKIFIIIFSVLFSLCILFLSTNIIIKNIDLNNDQQLIMDYINSPDKSSELLNTTITQNEISHLDDVNKIFKTKNTILNLLIIIISIIILKIRKSNKQPLSVLFFYGGITTFILPFFILLLSLINFTLTFEVLHRLIFPGGNYSFTDDSFLISNLPESFFKTIGIEIFILTIILGLIISLLAYYRIKKKKK